MKAIMAMAKNRCIGKDGKIPWYYKDDLKWFKEFTQCTDGSKIILMGKTTFNGLPLLKNRTIYILSKEKPKTEGPVLSPDFTTTMVVINDIDNLPKDKDVIIAGGKSVYELFMPRITEFYVTQLNDEHEGDTFMPPFEELFVKRETIKEFDFGKVLKYSK